MWCLGVNILDGVVVVSMVSMCVCIFQVITELPITFVVVLKFSAFVN